ncbi:MAG TPA: recombinase family protein [Gemmatimonadales bacterium]|nr:recombinase family protein [Gemmatimonadales bacterium]
MAEPIDVDAYLRVSTEEQANEGLSLGTQREKILLYAAVYDLRIKEVFVDAGVSAKTMNRPGLSAHLERLRRRVVEGTVIFKLDRLTRSLGDWSKLLDNFYSEKAGRQLLSVTDEISTRTANGRLALNILMTVAQWEREILSERTSQVLQGKIARGERCGKVRFGYDLHEDGVHLVENPTEQATLKLIKVLRGEGKSLRAIADVLKTLGIETKEGNQLWLPGTLARLLRRSA